VRCDLAGVVEGDSLQNGESGVAADQIIEVAGHAVSVDESVGPEEVVVSVVDLGVADDLTAGIEISPRINVDVAVADAIGIGPKGVPGKIGHLAVAVEEGMTALVVVVGLVDVRLPDYLPGGVDGNRKAAAVAIEVGSEGGSEIGHLTVAVEKGVIAL